jgi:RNA polymerase sigma-70 factor (ECF subfamily)
MVSSERVQRADECSARVLRLEDVFREHSKYVAAIGIRLLGRDNDIDDFLQDVFIEAGDGLKSVRDPNAVRGWLATLAVRKARRTIRKRMLLRRIFGTTQEDAVPAISNAASPMERYLLLRCYEVLETLSANQRLAWTLRHIEGETLPEVARMCECSLATAKRWIHKANARVQAEVGGTP